MKKLVAILLLGSFSLTLFCSCSIFKRRGASDETDDFVTDPVKEELVAVMNGSLDLDALSPEELLACYDTYLRDENEVLRQGALYDLLYKDETIRGEDGTAELGFEFPGHAQKAVFSDDPWETDRDYGSLDVTVGMTQKEKAAFESMMGDLKNTDIADINSQLEDTLHGIEGFENYEIGSDIPDITHDWPNSALGRAVPDPGFPGMTVVESGESISAVSTEANEAAVKAYVSKLKAAGFTVNANENEQAVAGYTIYSFSASDKNGVFVTIQFIQGTTSFSVTKQS